MTTEMRPYTDSLLFALRMRDVPGPMIAEALAEVRSHVTETGEDPLVAFGPPKEYAAEIASALGRLDVPGAAESWFTWSTVVYGVGGMVGSWLVLDGVLALVRDGNGPGGLPAAVSLLVGLAVLGAIAVGLRRIARHDADRVIDPLTGEDMAPPLPRWVLPLMVCPPLLILVLGGVLAVSLR